MRSAIPAAMVVGFLNAAMATASAFNVMVTDGDTLVLDGTPYRLDGIDAPGTDQICLDQQGSRWMCGIEARDQLRRLIAGRDVQCPGTQPDPVYRNRRISVCTVQGDEVSINERLVHQGWALTFEPYAKGRFKTAQEEARSNQSGLWKGCFTSPKDARNGRKKQSELLGSACAGLPERQARDALFPDDPTRPEGCEIKGSFVTRAHFTGHRGIYHLPGCRSYSRLKSPDRWFCSEIEAQAEGFRRAFSCNSDSPPEAAPFLPSAPNK